MLSSVLTPNHLSQEQLLDYVAVLEEKCKILEAENQQMKQAFEVSEIGIWDWKPETNEEYCSEVYYRMLGYKRDDFPPHVNVWFELLHPEDLARMKKQVEIDLSSQIILTEKEFRMKHKDGYYCWILSRGKVVEQNSEGKPTRTIGIHIDISEKKNTELELAAAKKSLLEHQYHLEDLVKRRTQSLEETQQKLLRSNAELENQTNELTDRNNLLREVTQVLQVKQAELNKALNRFQLANKALGGGLWESQIPENYTLTEQTPIWYSREFILMLGFDPDDFPNIIKSWSDLIHPDFKEYVFATYSDFIRGFAENNIYDIETCLRVKSGEYRWFRELATLVRNEAGKPVRETGVLIDIHEQKQATEAVRHSQELFRNFIVSSPAGCAVYFAPDIEYIYLNPALEELTGYDSYELHSLLPSELIHPDVRAEVWQQTEESGYVYPACKCIGKDGIVFWADVCRIKTFYQNKPAELIKFYDVTSRIKTEEALHESEELFRKLSENSPTGVIIFNPEKFYYCNPEFVRMIGYSLEELQVMSPFEVIDPEMLEIATEKVAQRIQQDRYDLKIKTKKGESKWLDFANVVFKYRGEMRVVGTFYDITQRKKAEYALQETNEELRATEEELRQQSEELLAVNENLEITKIRLEIVLQNEQEINKKLARRTKALAKQKKLLRATLKKLKEAQMQLVQSEKITALGVLVAGVAHEINNPVNYINASSEALTYLIEDIGTVIKAYRDITAENVIKQLAEIEKLKEQVQYKTIVKEVQEMIDNIRAGANQTAEIVRGLKVFSRMDNEATEYTDVHPLLDSSLILLHNQYKRNIEVIKEYNKLPIIQVYPGKLNQVFLNLLSNAIYAINARKDLTQGLIIIRTYVTEKDNSTWAVVEIADNGIGIPEKNKNRIFEPFFTNKEVGQGSGLGLSISLGIVESHHGKFEFDSEGGKGAVFRVYLPLD